jgi:hypothetical protein
VRLVSDVRYNKIKLNFELETKLAILLGVLKKKTGTELDSEKTSTNEKIQFSRPRFEHTNIFDDISK